MSIEDPRNRAIGDEPEGPPTAETPDVRPSVIAVIRRPSVRTRLAGQVVKSE